MFIAFQLFILLVFSIIFSSFFSKWVRIIASFLLGAFLTMQLVSVFLGGSLMDYKFYEHIHLKDIWSLKGFYATEFISFTIVLFLLCIVIYIGASFAKRFISKKNTRIAISSIALLTLFLPNGILHSSYQIVSLKLAADKSFNKALKDIAIKPSNYTRLNDIEATVGKNIIVLSLESFEKGYLEPPLDALTPNLQKLKKDYTYYNMAQNEGNGWTSASMYGTLTGLPAFFKQSGNETFQNAYESKITSLPAVLKEAGYDLTYLLGNKEFSGVSDMLRLFGFTVKSEKDFDTKYPATPWGIHDQDLFKEARKEVLKKQQSDTPYALFLSTISGHFPDGVKDARLEGQFPKQASNIEYMTYATDHFVGEFLKFLNTEQILDNTVVYIFPDHELMGNSATVVEKFNKRGLYLISTATASDIGMDSDKTLYQIDLPRVILNGAQVKTNATFLTDYLKDTDANAFIIKNKSAFVSLNEASLKTGDFKGGMTLSLEQAENDAQKRDNILTLSATKSGYTTQLGPLKENTLYTALFDNQMRFTKYQASNKEKAFRNTPEARLIFSISNGELFTYLKRGDFLGIAKRSRENISYSESSLQIFEDWTLLLPELKPDPKTLTLKSSGYDAFKTHGISRIHVGLQPYKPQRGIMLITFNEDGHSVTHYDTFVDDVAVQDLLSALQVNLEAGHTFAMIAHDSADKALKKESVAFEQLGFRVLATIDTREAYIGYHTNGTIQEFKDAASLSKSFPLPSPKKQDKNAMAKDAARYIAHAGGEIDGNRYTNALEALDYSYAQGLRYFELDIIKSSDGVFVAAHDWNTWKNHTGYDGETPVSSTEFLKHKIKEKYTPLNMKRINNWFTAHPDAILVTDKVNTPTAFATAFIDKSRLMMELFTLDAVKEARDLGIRSHMPSENVVGGLGANAVEKLKTLDVKHIAMSRKNIVKKIDLVMALKAAGIKTYVYHVNFEAGKDEQYVFDYELDYVFGMYVDKWSIEE